MLSPARLNPARGALLALLALAIAALIAACGGDDAAPASEGASGSSPTFLLASFTTLSEVQIGAGSKVLVRGGAGAFIRYPAISRDGSMIAYSRQQAARARPDGIVDFGADIYVAKRSGEEARLVVGHARPGQFLGSPIWLKDGKTLLYSSRGVDDSGRPDLHIAHLDLASGATRRLIEDVAEPSISADGNELVFVSLRSNLAGSELAISDVDGGNLKLVLPASAGLMGILSPVFSPDGKRIAFAAMPLEAQANTDARGTANAHPSTHDIWVMNRDGSGLTTFADIADINPSLSWSGDGRWLYVLGTGGIWRIEGEGKPPVKIADGIANAQFVWMADGQN